jgi:CheY-like chemotaxis protein
MIAYSKSVFPDLSAFPVGVGPRRDGRFAVGSETSCHFRDGKRDFWAMKVQKVSARSLTVVLDRMVPSGKVLTVELHNQARHFSCRRQLQVLYVFRDSNGVFSLGGIFDGELSRDEFQGLLERDPLLEEEMSAAEANRVPAVDSFKEWGDLLTDSAPRGRSVGQDRTNPSADQPLSVSASARRRGKTVLIIDHQDATRKALAVILKSEGYLVMAAATRREALEHLHAATPPDLVLLEVTSAADAGPFLRRDRPGLALDTVPVVLLAGSEARAEWAASLGAVGFIRKPINLDCLLALIQRCA